MSGKTRTVRKLKSSLPPRRIAASKRAAVRRQARATPETDSGAGGAAGAGAGAAAGGAGGDAPDKHSMCVDILVSGHVQSYVDFFYLTHRPDPNPDPSEDSKADKEIDVSVSDMTFIKDNLTRAEASRRKGETAAVYECYNSLAEYFQKQQDSKTGVYFYEKCLEMSRLTGDVAGEMTANRNLGSAYEALGNVQGAIRYHERHLEIAKEREDAIEQRQAHTQLVNVYRRHAEQLEAEGNYNDAAELHMRCLLSAQACGNRLAEGLANYRTGRVHVLLQEPQKAVPYLQNYLKVTQEMEGQEAGQGNAHAALAAAFQALSQTDKATGELEKFLAIAESTNNLTAQGEACSNLGVIFNRQGDFTKAVKYFERAYELMRTLIAAGEGTRKMVDSARVNLGMARGNARMGSYLNVINFDVKALLLWKNRRVLPAPSAAGAGTGAGAGSATQ